VPAQDRVRGDDRAQVLEHRPTEGLATDRRATALVVGEEDPLAAELLAEDAVLLAEVLDGFLLLLAEPAGEDGRSDLEDRGTWGKGTGGGS